MYLVADMFKRVKIFIYFIIYFSAIYVSFTPQETSLSMTSLVTDTFSNKALFSHDTYLAG